MTRLSDTREIPRADEIGSWVIDRCGGDAAEAPAALCEVAAELIKLSDNPAVTRQKFTDGLTKFMSLPARMFVADLDTTIQ